MAAGHGVLSRETVMGVLSLILWSLFIVISVKYCLFILRADNRGEGGIIALLALLGVRRIQPGSSRVYLAVFGLVGTALLYADGAITPAISVLSAIEGLALDAPQFGPYVCRSPRHSGGPVFRSADGDRLDRPDLRTIHAVLVHGARLLGLGGIVPRPGVLAAINPTYALSYMIERECRHDAGGPRGRVPGRDGRRGSLCGHRPFRPRSRSRSPVPGRDACSDAELFRPGSIAADASDAWRTRSTTSRPIGRIIRWSYSRRWPP